MYAMGMMAHFFQFSSASFLPDYYTYTTVFLFVPTILLLENLTKILKILGIENTD